MENEAGNQPRDRVHAQVDEVVGMPRSTASMMLVEEDGQEFGIYPVTVRSIVSLDAGPIVHDRKARAERLGGVE